MKKTFLALMCTATLNGATNKTFLAPRPAGVNLAMEDVTWHPQINKPEGNDDKFGASIQVVGFYQEATNERNLGKYFGFDNKRTFTIGNASDTNVEIDKRHLLHDHQDIRNHEGPNGLTDSLSGDNPFSGVLDIKARYESAGFRIDYQQDLDSVVEGLHFKVRAPIIWQDYELRIGVDNSVSATIGTDETASDTLSGISSTTVDILDYFSGSITQSAGSFFSDQQAALSKAKANGEHSKTCLADIDVLLGWNFWETEDYHAGVNLGITIPTSPTPKGEFVFEPQCGNRGHFGLGAGLNTKFTIMEREDESIQFSLIGDWRYLFESDERRTLGLIGKNWGQYFLFGENGQKGVFPAANVLTRKVDVKPGHQTDIKCGFAYNTINFTLDVGYNFYARESEQVKIREAFPSNTYGIAGNDYNSGDRDDNAITGLPAGHGTFTNADIAIFDNVTIAATAARSGSTSTQFLTQSNLDTAAAESPGIITHKIYGGFGYAWNEWDTPLMIGFGGSYELASVQKTLEQWAIWGKMSISF